MDGEGGTLRGVAQTALAKIAPALQNVIDAGDLSGFVTLTWREGEELQCNALGHRDIDAGLPMTRDTLFRIASMTKPITSVAALMLMEEGKLRLEDPITRWMPEFADMKVLKDAQGPFVAASDYMKVLPESIGKWVPGQLVSLGTDGFGRSESRAALRDFFEVDAKHIVLATLAALAREKKVGTDVVKRAIRELGIHPEKANPAIS